MMFGRKLQLRVKEYENGWVVEIRKRKWYGRYYWVHLISASGLPDTPWEYSSSEVAVDDAARMIRVHLLQSNPL